MLRHVEETFEEMEVNPYTDLADRINRREAAAKQRRLSTRLEIIKRRYCYRDSE